MGSWLHISYWGTAKIYHYFLIRKKSRPLSFHFPPLWFNFITIPFLATQNKLIHIMECVKRTRHAVSHHPLLNGFHTHQVIRKFAHEIISYS